jgi:hypothetical protein
MVLSSQLEALIGAELTVVGRIHKCRFEAEGLMQLVNAPISAQYSPVRYQGIFDDATALFEEANRLDQVCLAHN